MNVEQQENERFYARASMESNVHIEAAIEGYAVVTKSSYKLRDGRQVVHYKCDHGGVDRNRHRISEESRMRKGKGSVLVDRPFKGIRRQEKGKSSNHIINVSSPKSHS